MKHKEFRRAAIRHLETCNFLINKLKDANAKYEKEILDDIYYISGYVIETSLSYTFFNHIRWKYNLDIEECDHFKSQQFKTHILNQKMEYMRKKGVDFSGIELIDRISNPVHNKLISNWSHEIRYQSVRTKCRGLSLDKDMLDSYIESIKKMYTQLMNKYDVY